MVLRKDGTFVISVMTVGSQVTREILRVGQPEAIMLGDWTRDGRSIVFIKGRTDGASPVPRHEIWAVSGAGGPPRYLNIAMDGLQDVRMHADGERIAFKTGGRRRELWVLDNVLSGRATHR